MTRTVEVLIENKEQRQQSEKFNTSVALFHVTRIGLTSLISFCGSWPTNSCYSLVRTDRAMAELGRFTYSES
jgi:hypothetical protein